MLIPESLKFGNTINSYAINEPDECPLCHVSIKPEKIHIHPYWSNRKKYAAAMYMCTHCSMVFCTLYECIDSSTSLNGRSLYLSKLLYIGPTRYIEQSFDQSIAQLSPQFVKIFNQAKAAESSSLDEIAGIGYRKALEFLVKDYCIHLHPEKEQDIKETPLSRCIRDYIDISQIQTLAERATWIGNDETHYIRKHEDRDVTDMKRFIDAMVHFISMTLIVEDASTINPS